MGDDRIERLKALLRRRAVRFGDFQLSKGGRTDVYVDGRLLTLSSEGAALAGELMWEAIAPLKPDALGGMTLGADPIVGATLAHAGRLGIDVAGFLVRKEPKGHGLRKCVEGPRPDKEAPRVVVLDDTFTTGGSTLDAARRVQAEWGAEVIGAFCIVDREAGAQKSFAAIGVDVRALVTLDELRG